MHGLDATKLNGVQDGERNGRLGQACDMAIFRTGGNVATDALGQGHRPMQRHARFSATPAEGLDDLRAFLLDPVSEAGEP